jgi:hypothetical protein
MRLRLSQRGIPVLIATGKDDVHALMRALVPIISSIVHRVPNLRPHGVDAALWQISMNDESMLNRSVTAACMPKHPVACQVSHNN